uniref:Coiled coil domain-containing protein n=1 Tax=Chlorobium chlorochromatii (strain CaD3) TaxID=340177 RepID=Q3ARS2_CHLCH
MNLQEAYKQKAETELELAHTRLVEFRAKVKNLNAEAHLNYAKQLDDFEHGITTAKEKLHELGEAGEDAWEKLKDGVESALRSSSKTLQEIADKFKD